MFDKYDRMTYILKVTTDDNIFICNRNSNDFDNIFNDKYVRWWESDLVDIMKFSIADRCEILEVLPFDNYNKRHQKQINPIKEKYIQMYNAEYLDDNVLSNILFNEIKENYRNKYRYQYKDFKFIIDKCGDEIYNLLYEKAKDLYRSSSESYFLSLTRDELWNVTNRKIETKVCYIILRDYLSYRKGNNKKNPFDKYTLRETLHMLVKLNDLEEKRKTRKIIKDTLFV